MFAIYNYSVFFSRFLSLLVFSFSHCLMTLILGLNAFHVDSAAVLVRDGIVIAAAEEERFRRIKHWAFPSEAINWCLADAGISLGVDHIAINTQPKAQRWRKVAYTLMHRPSLCFGID